MMTKSETHVANRGLWGAFKRSMSRMSHVSVMQAELAEAQVALLEAQTGQEYARAMVKYNSDRVARLSAALEHEMAKVRTARDTEPGGP